jgi:hypothetical protein
LQHSDFEEKVTKENFRNHNPRDYTPIRLPEFRCWWLFVDHQYRRAHTEIEHTLKPSTHLPMISGALIRNLDQRLSKNLRSRNRQLSGVNAQSRGFISGAITDSLKDCRGSSAPEIRLEGG